MKNNITTPNTNTEEVQLIAAQGFTVIGWDPRACDFEMVRDMCANTTSQREQIDAVADYCWDHLLGESDEVTPAKIRKAIREGLNKRRGARQ